MAGTDESGQGLQAGRGAAPEPRGGVGSGFSKDMYTKRFDGREDPQPSGSNQVCLCEGELWRRQRSHPEHSLFPFLFLLFADYAVAHLSFHASAMYALVADRNEYTVCPDFCRCSQRRSVGNGSHVCRDQHAVATNTRADGQVSSLTWRFSRCNSPDKSLFQRHADLPQSERCEPTTASRQQQRRRSALVPRFRNGAQASTCGLHLLPLRPER